MRHRFTAALGAALLAGVGLLSACGTQEVTPGSAMEYSDGTEYPATADMVAVVDTDTWPIAPSLGQGKLNDAYTHIHRDMELHPENYTGVYQTMNGGCPHGLSLVVGTPHGKAAQALEHIKKANLPASCAQGVSVQESAASVSTAERMYQIQHDVYKTLPGIYGNGIYWDRHLVVIDVGEVTDDLRRKAKSLYGDDVALDITAKPEALSRNNDFSPFYAGSLFRMYAPWDQSITLGSCTMGIPWKLGTSHTYTITAGHCLSIMPSWGSQRTGVKTDYCCTNGYGAGRQYSNDGYGSTVSECSTYVNSGYGDLALIDHNYWPLGAWLGRASDNKIWHGGPTTGIADPVTQWATYSIGTTVSVSAGVTGDSWGYTVDNVDQSYVYDNTCGQSTTWFQMSHANSGNSPCLQPGDSGSPVRNSNGDGTWTIGGVVSGAGGTCHIYFTPARYASYKWGGGMN